MKKIYKQLKMFWLTFWIRVSHIYFKTVDLVFYVHKIEVSYNNSKFTVFDLPPTTPNFGWGKNVKKYFKYPKNIMEMRI